MTIEPKIHSHLTDVLPESHPLAQEEVFCAECGEMVHAANNECMQTWVETGAGAYCLRCFARAAGDVMDDKWGLPDGP